MDVIGMISAAAAWVAALTAIVIGRSTVAQAQQTRTQMRAQHVDSLAPMLTVEMGNPDWPPYEPSTAYGRVPNELVEESAHWRMPAQATQRRLMIVAKARLRNIGASPALIALGPGGRFLQGEPDAPDALIDPPLGTDVDRNRQYRLGPQETVWAAFIDVRTVGEWCSVAQSLAPDAVGELLVAIRVDDIFDFGMTDLLSVTLRSNPVEGSGSDAGSWRLRSPHLTLGTKEFMSAEVTPVERIYWESRTREAVLLDMGRVKKVRHRQPLT